MAGNFFDRLGGLFGRRDKPAEEQAPAETSAEVVTEAAPPVATEAAPTEPYVAPAEPVVVPEAPAPPTVASEPAVAEPTVVAETAAQPVKSAEEELEEKLWAETHEAWAKGDFETVTTRLDALKVLQPEDAAEIEEKIAAALFNHASQIEESGDLQRALYLFQEAQRRNPNLGEAVFAIERVQNKLAPVPAAAAMRIEAPAEAPAERTYTVSSGDSLSAIAERMYGSASEWPKIFEANRDKIDNPDLIHPGQELRIP